MVTADLVSKINKKNILHIYKELYNLTNDAEKMLKSNELDIKKFGELLNYSWEMKKKKHLIL